MEPAVWLKNLLPERLYPVPGDPRELAGDEWTVSPEPNRPGWETDTGCTGYGLPRHVAEAICEAWNTRMAMVESFRNYGKRSE